jgi:ketosteroid isomerase-like protein
MSGPGSIRHRNRENSIEAQTQLWRAMCDKPKTIRKYVTDDCVIADIDNSIYTSESSPTTREFLDEHFEPWTAYRIHGDPEFVEVDMMSASLVYRVTAWRQDEAGQMIPTEAMCTSVWRQGAGGSWKCCVHHMSKI